MSDEKRDDELGALWIKQGSKGEFMTGSVICTQCNHKEDIILFGNQFKTKDNHPAWRILKSRQQGERHTHVPSTRRDEQRRDPRPPTRQQTLGVRPEEFDSRQVPQQTKAWPPAGQQRLAKPAPRGQSDWTNDVPHPVGDDDIGF